ncbi:NHL repeat-containing protein [Actinomadura montaniterrae]|uniref:Uncharacterized protein n=1 Tax=Actinomadura montaniterrae TaxID=1803903 RepID=A0A6L3W5Q6_9ACTN|nr:hypothetical protein [Actinomadura montaniterrae]KAB2385924.1 hypothetical protein F9B16_08975 [Actinomadura montaniterrae]
MLVVLALLATLLGTGRIGHAIAASDGSAWLWSRVTGEAGRVNPDSGRVEQRRAVPDARGHRVQVTENDQHLIIHDLDTGRVSSLDLTGPGFSGRLDIGTRGDPHLAMGATAAVVIERASGMVRVLDPATLRPVGSVLRLPGPLAGGEFDGSGRLWVALPHQGTVASLEVTAKGASIARAVEVADPGSDLALSVLDQGALVVDRSGRDVVLVTGEHIRRVTAPVPLAGALVPERIFGALAAVTVPAAGSVVTLDAARTPGHVRSFPLRDPVQDPVVPFAGKVYVPARETGQVRVLDPAGRETGVLSLPEGRGDLELRVREGNLFVNAPGTEHALVVGTDGRPRTVGKYGTGQGAGRPAAPGDGNGPPPVPAPPASPIFPQPPDALSPGRRPSHGIPLPTPERPERPTPRRPVTKTPARRSSGTSPSVPKPGASTPSKSKPRPKPTQLHNPYTPQQVCNAASGGGYKVQRSTAFSGGRVYLLYSAGTKKNCAVTMKTTKIGTGTSVKVRLEEKSGGEVGQDSGTFKYYAGPVYVTAPGVCVRYSGGASGVSVSAGWGNCG